GCSVNEIQAPYDSFVCYNSSYDHCLTEAQHAQLKTYLKGSFASLDRSGYKVEDPDANKPPITSTADNKNHCNMGTIPYTQTLDPKQLGSVVFVSPVLLSQIGEQLVKVEHAREACLRLVQA